MMPTANGKVENLPLVNLASRGTFLVRLHAFSVPIAIDVAFQYDPTIWLTSRMSMLFAWRPACHT